MSRWWWLAALPALAGCAAERESGSLFGPEEAGVIVIDGTLLVDAPLGDVFVRRTASPAASYEAARLAVQEARVVLQSGEQRWTYTPDPDSAGRYLPPQPAPAVEPETAYELLVEADGRTVRARTVTPPRLRLREAVVLDEETLADQRHLRLFAEAGPQAFKAPDNLVPYRTGLLELRVDPRPGATYQLALFSLDPGAQFLVDESFLEPDDANDFDRQGSSPPVAAVDGRVRLPWFAVAFSGRHLVKLYALDANWYDFARSTGDGGAFGGLIGDSFERPLFRIDGGVGLFGSAAVDSLGFTVLPRPEPGL